MITNGEEESIKLAVSLFFVFIRCKTSQPRGWTTSSDMIRLRCVASDKMNYKIIKDKAESLKIASYSPCTMLLA